MAPVAEHCHQLSRGLITKFHTQFMEVMMTATKPRDAVFREIQTLVGEYDDAVSIPHTDARWNIDDALSDLIIRLNGETRRVRKLNRSQAA